MEDQLKFMQKIHDAGGNYVCTNGIVNLMNNITFKHQKSIINLLVYGYYKEGPEEQEYERVVKIMDEALYEKANKTKHGVIVS